MVKILITDCWTRKALSAVRSLGEEGVQVHAVSHTRIAPAVYSKYIHRYHIAPDPKKNPGEYLQKILQLLEDGAYDCIMPLEESSIEIFLSARSEIEKNTLLPLTDAGSYFIANNKWKVLQMASELSVPIPKTFCPATQEEIETALQQLQYPFIIKPVSSSGSRGIKKIFSREEFNKQYPLVVTQYGPPLLQECIAQEGEGCGVAILARDGNVQVDFSYKRLREFPVKGGPGTLRESTNDEQLKQYAATLVKALNWTGVAMVEFKRDPLTNEPKLMEINPRFWGSLALAQAAGINFPFLLYKLSKGEMIAQQKYEPGIMCRWLLPGDIAHFIANPKRFSLKPSFFHFFDRKLYYDDFCKEDMKGNIAVVLCTIAMVFDPSTWKLGVFRK